MSDHKSALVPLSIGHFNSPGLIGRRQSIDIGLLAEALVYYDHVLLIAENQQQFGDLVGWFLQRNLFSKFLDLLHGGDLQVYYNAFRTTVYVEGDRIEPFNAVEKLEQKPDCFAERFLGNEAVKKQFPRRRLLHDLRDALNGKVVEVKVDEFGAEGIDNAKRDFLDPRRCALLLQAVVDELYRVKSLGRPPEVRATIQPVESESGLVRVTWNIDFEELSRRIGTKLAFGHSLALSGAVIGNTYLWSAQRQGCDLYLPRPISVIVGDKLYEAGQTLAKTPAKAQSVVDQLESEVEFPDLRRWVNEGKIEFKEVLKMRKKAKRFRQWLQAEADKDRNVMIFYLQEAAKESGFTRTGRISVSLFGIIGGGVAGNLIGNTLSTDPTTSSYIGSAAGGTMTYLLDLASKFRSGWKPYVFGDWYKGRIEKLLAKQAEEREEED